MTTRRLSPFAVALLVLPFTFAPTRAASLASLGWMAGSWSVTQGGVANEEHWLPPSGGLMLGMHRDVKAGRAASFEFLRIVERNDSLVYVALPRGRNETPFPLKSLEGRRVVFENPAHDFPQRILYWQVRPNELHARVEGTWNGKEEFEEWTWKRTSLTRSWSVGP